ncbi:cinnamoyl-CoA reductase 1-like [Chenopodium quinoa]|uniref:cinnamoyl-CoA reductase 1-like n=1 Tax=Chenopodium quinoa TaxID=63459 RepID=UPI000B77F394|nr:cinnamoyl-CoA reductase 1-like [Chenopodium quinoa]
MSGAGKTVCVTGASGYIASWLVKLLLHRGYSVNATVRDLNDPKKVEHLRSLDGAKDRLHLFTVNLLEEGSFDAVLERCEGVFHIASPFFLDIKDPEAELLDPAVKGTLNVLESCAKFPSIKRVVLTSSMAAISHNGKPLTPEVVVDETWFTDPNLVRESKMWYVLSKILAEEAAWKFVKEKGIDMVSINPAVVIGPLLQPTLNTSAAVIVSLFDGSETFNNMTFGWVHVKDVAMAHILAFEVPSAKGRYCLVESVAHYDSDIVKELKELYPNAVLFSKCKKGSPLKPVYQVAKEKTQSLGIDYIPLKTSLKETVESLKEKGFISI